MAHLAKWMRAAKPQPQAGIKPARIEGRGGGYGMVAEHDISKGDKLVSVPRELWLTSGTARESDSCREVLESGTFDNWQAMSLHLLCERRKGPDSFWSPYMDILPDQAEHPLAWNDDTLAWLQGSPMAARLAARREQVHSDTDVLRDAGANSIPWSVEQADGNDLVTLRSMRWAASTLLSRAFQLQIPLEDPPDLDAIPDAELTAEHFNDVPVEHVLCLVPWADSLNHSADADERSILQFDHAHTEAVLFAHRDYEAGEEVFDSYGTSETPSSMLLNFGFVGPDMETAIITVPASHIVSSCEGVNEDFMTGLQGHFGGTPDMQMTDTGIDTTLLSFLRSTLCPADDLRKAGWPGLAEVQRVGNYDVPMDVMAQFTMPTDINMEAKVLEAILAWVDRQLRAYSSSLKSDVEELAQPSTAWLRTQALRALVSEKRALLGIQRKVREHLQDLREGCPLDALYD